MQQLEDEDPPRQRTSNGIGRSSHTLSGSKPLLSAQSASWCVLVDARMNAALQQAAFLIMHVHELCVLSTQA